MIPSFAQGYARNASESANPDLWRGLTAAWLPSLGVTGSTLYDVSGNGHHGTMVSMDPATAWIVSEHGSVLDYDGVNNYIELPTALQLISPSQLTVSIWFENQNIEQQSRSFIGCEVGSTGWKVDYRRASSQGELRFFMNGGSERVEAKGTKFKTEALTHIVCVYDGVTADISVNGVLEASAVYTGGIATTAGHFALGADGTSSSASGKIVSRIGNVQIYNRALTHQERLKLYTDGSSALVELRRSTGLIVPVAAVIIIGQALETDQALVFTSAVSTLLSQAIEIDAAVPIIGIKKSIITSTAETDSSQLFSSDKLSIIDQVFEIDQSLVITESGNIVLNIISELDLASTLTGLKTSIVSQATESDLSVNISSIKSSIINEALESDESFIITSSVNIILGQSAEIDSSAIITGLKLSAITSAAEADLAQLISGDKSSVINQVVEIDVSAVMSSPSALNIGLVTELDVAFIILGQVVNIPSSISFEISLANVGIEVSI